MVSETGKGCRFWGNSLDWLWSCWCKVVVDLNYVVTDNLGAEVTLRSLEKKITLDEPLKRLGSRSWKLGRGVPRPGKEEEISRSEIGTRQENLGCWLAGVVI